MGKIFYIITLSKFCFAYLTVVQVCVLTIFLFNVFVFSESDNLVEVEVEFDYEAELSDELSLKTGDIVENVKRMEGGWWEGSLNGKRGVFPDNFVKVGQ